MAKGRNLPLLSASGIATSTVQCLGSEFSRQLLSRELTYPTKREKEHHLQKCLFWVDMLVFRVVFLSEEKTTTIDSKEGTPKQHRLMHQPICIGWIVAVLLCNLAAACG